MSTTQNKAIMKLTKEMSGLYTFECEHNGQTLKLEFSQSCGVRGWSWSSYLDGMYAAGDGGNGFVLKDFRHAFKVYGPSYFID